MVLNDWDYQVVGQPFVIAFHFFNFPVVVAAAFSFQDKLELSLISRLQTFSMSFETVLQAFALFRVNLLCLFI